MNLRRAFVNPVVRMELSMWSFQKRVLTVACVVVMLIAIPVCGQEERAQAGTPPQFLTLPIHMPQQAAQTVLGRLVYNPAFVQSRSGGTAVTTLAPASSITQTAGTNVDVSNALDSYQGEPMLFSKGSVLIGGYNSIYPGNC